MRVAVIIPVRNEAAALREVLAEIPTEAGTPPRFVGGVADGSAERRSRRPRELVCQVIVVDNGSTDGSADVARRCFGEMDQDRVLWAGLGSGSVRGTAPLAPARLAFARAPGLARPADGGTPCPLGRANVPLTEPLAARPARSDEARAWNIVSEPTPGYGQACLAGIAALDPSIDTVVFMDGDHSDCPEELPKLLEPIAQGRADLVIGSRTALAQPGSLTLPQRFGNRLACALMRRLFGARYTDLGPFRAIRREALQRLQMRDRAFGWTVEMQAKAARAGLRIAEVSVRYRPRIGRSKISGTLSGTIRAGIGILSTIGKVALE